ncbi:MAG: hypothetical protein IPK26_12670 [Planctomycetes bacterium]|nr:hypothetical protein [Planctomycetota bacterium]
MRVAHLLSSVVAGLALLPAQDRALRFLPVQDLVTPRETAEPWLWLPLGARSRGVANEESLFGLEHAREPFSDPRSLPRQAWFGEGLGEMLAAIGYGSDATWLRGRGVLAVPANRAEALGELLAAVRRRLPPVVHGELELTRSDAGKRVVVLQRTFAAASGSTEVLSDVTAAHGIGDYEVEIAQSASTANPVPRALLSGAMVALRPHVVPGGEAAIVEVLARSARSGPRQAINLGHPSFGPVDRGALAVSSCAAVARVHLGGTSSHRWRGPDGAEWALTIRMQWQVPQPAQPGGQAFEYLVLPPSNLGFRSEQVGFEVEREILPADDGGAADLAAQVGADVRFKNGRAAVFVGEAAPRMVVAANALLETLAATPAVTMTLVDVPTGSRPAPDGALPADGRIVGEATIAPVQGVWSSIQVYDDQSYLRDWDVEVAQASRIPDPKVDRLASGLFVDMRCTADAVTLTGEWVRLLELTTEKVALSAAIGVPPAARGSGGNNNAPVQVHEFPALHLPPDEVNFERPVVQRLPLRATLQLQQGKTTSVRAAGDGAAAPGRELWLCVRRAD